MTRYAALLGSINVGGNRLKMAELVAALARHGFDNLETVAASGNVLFDFDRVCDGSLQDTIGAVVKSEFGIDTFAVVRSRPELEAALSENPFVGEGEDKFVHVHFLAGQPTVAQFDTLLADQDGRGPERLAPGKRALHIDYVSGAGSSKLTGAFIERRLGFKGTARNVRSLRRIIEKFD